VADPVRTKMALPPAPRTLEELISAPRALYQAFEARQGLVKAALHSELFHRMRDTQAKVRWTAIRRLVDECAPRRSERDRRFAAANIRYHLAASTWHYYRFYFRFSPEHTIACAEIAIRQSLEALGRKF
jgi:hypothetical protein